MSNIITYPTGEDRYVGREFVVGATTKVWDGSKWVNKSFGNHETRLQKLEEELTTSQLMNSNLSSLKAGDIIETNGFYSGGDGAGSKWLLTSVTGAPSQSPADLGDIKVTDALGRVWQLVIMGNVINPMFLGAGAGSDDGDLLNVCFQWLRDNVSQSGETAGFDGGMRSYITTKSINATKIVGWNWFIKNIDIQGKNTGTITLDCIGSRGGSMSNVSTEGDKDNMPSAGIVFARAAQDGFQFVSHWKIQSVSTLGYYSVTGFYAYGQETTDYGTCKFWNYSPNARAAVFTGTDLDVSISSQYAPPITGDTSYINNTYNNIDARYLPLGNSAPITNISKSNPCVVSVSTTREWADGDNVSLGLVKGMTELNNRSYEIVNVTSNSFELVGVDSTGFTDYSEGGSVFLSNTVPPVYTSRLEGHEFVNLYIVSYGAPHLELSNSGRRAVKHVTLKCLFEGFGSSSHLHISNLTSELDLIDFNLSTYNSHANSGFISAEAGSNVNLSGSSISVANFVYGGVNLFSTPSRFALRGVQINYPRYALVNEVSAAEFSGIVTSEDREMVVVNSSPIKTYIPTVTSASGTLGGYTVKYYKYKVSNGIVKASISIFIDDIGTASGNIYITNPTTPTSLFTSTGRENALTGEQFKVLTAPTATIAFPASAGGFQTGNELILSPEYF